VFLHLLLYFGKVLSVTQVADRKFIKLTDKIQPSGIDTQDLSSFGVCEILFSLKPPVEVRSLALIKGVGISPAKGGYITSGGGYITSQKWVYHQPKNLFFHL
jgi:hypothetical protein